VANNAFNELAEVTDNALFEHFSCKYLDYHWTKEVTFLVFFFKM
jgi:hypothetical protein